MDEQIKLLRIPEVAERLACGKGTVYKLIRQGELPAVNVAADMRVTNRSVTAFIDSLSAKKGE